MSLPRAGHEDTRRQAGDNLSFDFLARNAGVEQPVARRLAVVAGLGFDMRRHDAADPLFLVKRKVERLDLQAGLTFALADRLFLQPTLTCS